MSHFEGHFEGAKTFLTPLIVPSAARDNLGVKKLLSQKKKIMSQIFLNSGTLVILCLIATMGPQLCPAVS